MGRALRETRHITEYAYVTGYSRNSANTHLKRLAKMMGFAKSLNPSCYYIALCAINTLAPSAAVTDYTGKDISGKYRTL
jgi:hypothetical protein